MFYDLIFDKTKAYTLFIKATNHASVLRFFSAFFPKNSIFAIRKMNVGIFPKDTLSN
jgi:hypothetical protein